MSESQSQHSFMSGIKHARAGHLGYISKLYKEVETLMANVSYKDEVPHYKQRIESAYKKYEEIHAEYIGQLPEEEKASALELKTSHDINKSEIISRMDEWLKSASEEKEEKEEYASLISNARSKSIKSRVSRFSTLSSKARMQEALVKRDLAVLKAKQLEEQQQIEREKQRLEQQAAAEKQRLEQQAAAEKQRLEQQAAAEKQHLEQEAEAKRQHLQQQAEAKKAQDEVDRHDLEANLWLQAETACSETNVKVNVLTSSNLVTELTSDQAAGYTLPDSDENKVQYPGGARPKEHAHRPTSQHLTTDTDAIATDFTRRPNVSSPINNIGQPTASKQLSDMPSTIQPKLAEVKTHYQFHPTELSLPTCVPSFMHPKPIITSAHTPYRLFETDVTATRPLNSAVSVSAPLHTSAELPHYSMAHQSRLMATAPEYIPRNNTIPIYSTVPHLPPTDAVLTHSQAPVISSTSNQTENALIDALQHISTVSDMPKADILYFSGKAKDYYKFINHFEVNIMEKVSDPRLRLSYLIQHCKDEPKELIEDCVLLPPENGFKQALQLLKSKYGSAHLISRSFIDSLVQGHQIKANDMQSLSKLSNEMRKCQLTLTQMGYLSDLNSQGTLSSIVKRLPYHLRVKWAEKAHTIIEKHREPTFSDLTDFVVKKSDVMSTIYGRDLIDDSRPSRKVTPGHKHGFTGVTGGVNASKEGKSCMHCSGDHYLNLCPEFLKLTPEKRFEFVKAKKLCFNCLHRHHSARDCKRNSLCKKCDKKHNSLLHLVSSVPKHESRSDQSRPPAKDHPPQDSSGNSFNTMKYSQECEVYLRIVPVIVKNGSKCLKTYAMLDDGSQFTCYDKRLLSMLGIDSSNEKTVGINTLNHVSQQKIVEADLHVSSLDGRNQVYLKHAWSVNKIPVSRGCIPDCQVTLKWPHLKELEFPAIDGDVTILIGSDNPEVFWSLEEKRGGKKDPLAVKSLLGWTLLGPKFPKADVNCGHAYFQMFAPSETLDEKVDRLWNTEFNDHFSSETAMSIEDKCAYDVMQKSAKLDNGHYMIDMPWKEDPKLLPNNRSLADVRLSYVKRKLDNDENLRAGYTKTVNDYVEKGYARKMKPEEISDTEKGCWYLPHFAVINPNKPGKVRVVYDAAAKYKNVSLNDQLLKGPDLVCPLVSVLIKFRQHPIAIMADIEAMFLRVKVGLQDQNYLRFLWYEDGDLSKQPKVYCMTRHIFGAKSSPSCASYALKQVAKDNKELYDKDVIDIVNQNFYVDDMLKACENVEIAKKQVRDVTDLLARGGFRLTKWLSNSQEVIDTIPETERAKSNKVELFEQERALGVNWDIANDSIVFTVKPLNKQLTKRGLLSMTSQLYDPMGLIAPILILPKLIFQAMCRDSTMGWDDPVPDELGRKWLQWKDSLQNLTKIHIPRHFKNANINGNFIAELHHFCDASEQAYAAASYVRIYDVNENISCHLLMGKARVVPIKPVTIPRLELTSAVVAVRLHQIVIAALDLPIQRVCFWTDSVSNLKYIRNRTKRFKTFIANRLAIIHEATDEKDWHYVPSKCNVADLATRGMILQDNLEEWLTGPKFLRTQVELPNYSVKLENNDIEVELEVKKTILQASSHTTPLLNFMNYFSSWTKLKRATAWLIRFKLYFIHKFKPEKYSASSEKCTTLSVEELQTAEIEILKQIQKSDYDKEISCLRAGTRINKSSSIYKLQPQLENDLLVVGGRLHRAELPERLKHPAILPKHHHVTTLIIQHYHNTNGHVGINYVLSMLRENYWIIRGYSTVKTVLKNCIKCKRYLQSPEQQQMAPLPAERVTPCLPVFNFTGVDYFGPMYVKNKRSQEKRYGCLFTCLTTRATHIEISNNLSTDSFLCALSRFISRRGKPAVMYSDNGTNFVRADKELREEIDKLNQATIDKFCTQKNIVWKFNPPTASHFGGIWERVVKSVKAILRMMLKEQVPTHEALVTVMCEIEKILNDRPLTKLSDDLHDPLPLTPNMLLLLQCNTSLPPGLFSATDNFCKRWWKQAHYLADIFWKRFIREYLPLLNTRSKWQHARRNLAVGDLVLMCEENTPRGQWPIGLVVEVYKGKDNLVRSVKVKKGHGFKVRPISKLCLLEAVG